MVIGTQNPTSMAGRRVQSTALSRRLTTLEVEPYTTEEMVNILNAKGIAPSHANAFVSAYQQETFRAQHELSPPPTFRDLLKVAEAFLRAQSLRTSAAPKSMGLGFFSSAASQKGPDEHLPAAITAPLSA
jgi:hypothetical protein